LSGIDRAELLCGGSIGAAIPAFFISWWNASLSACRCLIELSKY
jgi:hypothetical protein